MAEKWQHEDDMTTQTITVAEYQVLLKKQSNTRGNQRVTVDGFAFDSKAESRRYAELLLLEAAGQIEDLTVHPVYLLQASFVDSAGRKHKAISYEGDFGYTEVLDPQSIQGRAVVEDVKGHRTEVFRLKEKLFRFRYPAIDFRVLDIS
jgi:hypothetical protein